MAEVFVPAEFVSVGRGYLLKSSVSYFVLVLVKLRLASMIMNSVASVTLSFTEMAIHFQLRPSTGYTVQLL